MCFLFGWGEGKGGLASVSEYLFYKESKSKGFFFFFFWGGGGGERLGGG